METLRLPLFLLLALLLASSCRRDEKFTDDSGISLDLSQDTILFDTLFTTTNSVTKRFTVRNPNDGAVRVDIQLEGGTPSSYRINVDGATGVSFEDIEIFGGDSLYVFVECNVDGSNVTNPFLVEDFIRFNTNGTEQSVLLLAYGQNAVFYMPDNAIQGLPPFSYIAGGFDENGVQICETVTWTNELPIVLFGYAVVDSCCTLIIDPGVEVYVHGGGGLWVYKYGRILANGDLAQPIIIQGDRLEPFYAELPGQWDRIWINEGPGDYENRLENVLIKNALIGIQCEPFPADALAPTSETKLVLNNVRIRNCSAAGILSRNYKIDAANLLVGDCGQYAVALTGGGEYYFDHFTIANYWSYSIRQTPAFYMTNAMRDINNNVQIRDITNSSFVNSIVHGANANEFLIEFDEALTPDLQFDNMMLKTDQPTQGPFFPFPNSIYRNQNPAFVNVQGRDFHIGVNSFARDKADPSSPSFFDLDGVSRGTGDGLPDLGCYEYVE